MMKGLSILFKFSVALFALILFSVLVGGTLFAQGGATVSERVNLGLYGGAAGDLTYSNSTKRLFSGVETPASLFYTDDSCKTWIRAFPEDSLEWNSGQRGWGGGGRQIHCNNASWVLVLTQQHGGNLSSSVISKSNGDSGTFLTLMDPYLLNTLFSKPGPGSVTAIALTDYYAFVAMRNYIIMYDGSTRSLIFDLSTVSGIATGASILSLAVANSVDTFPAYFVATSAFDAHHGDLYKWASSTATKLSLPSVHLQVHKVFTHPQLPLGDTVIISCIDTVTHLLSAYRSLDGGSSWNNITPLNMSQFALSDVDYSTNWVSSMATSKGMRIVLPGSAYSDDIGNSWLIYQIVNNSNATHPENPNFVVGSRGRGPVISQNGSAGPWVLQDNYGLSAVKAGKIASSKGVYYISTNAGLAYTTAYFNPSVAPFDKWNPPYGQFPVPNAGDDAGVSSVAIDPNDSLHVITGYSWGLSVSTSGHTGFTNVTPAGWNSSPNFDQMVTDIKFVTSNIVLATTGSKLNQAAVPTPIGNIWKSINGGTTWTKVTPAGLEQPNCLDVNTLYGSTVAYVGCGYRNMGGPSVTGSLWKSLDQGSTWTKINDGPNSIMGYDSLMPILDLVIDTFALDTLYIAAGENLGHALVISNDGGSSYNYTSISGEGEFTSILQYNPNMLFVANRREIFAYNISANTHIMVSRAMPGEFIPDLERGSLLAATNTGVYKINVSDTTFLSIHPLLNTNFNSDLKIVPNPFVSTFELLLTSQNAQSIQIEMFDISGKQIMFMESQINEGQNRIQMDTERLHPGLYFIKIVMGNQSISTKLLKIEN